VIELHDIAKRFVLPPRPGRNTTTVEALRGVTLSVAAGEAIGVVGPNGAGKSTLFALILGFLKRSSGRISVQGLPPRVYMHTHGAAYLPERFQLPPAWNVESALKALAQLDGAPDSQSRTDQVIERLGLGEHLDKPIAALSRGLLQRVGIAQAVLTHRDLVVLDEPTEGLDPVWRLRLRELIQELRNQGCTLLIASHDLFEIERLVQRVILFERGTIRDSFAVAHTEGGARVFRIELRNPVEGLEQIFPGAEHENGGRAITVTVADTDDLSARLAALLAAGGIVELVTPADSVEQRVRAALRPEAKP
jgi:ABC-2 type transport system ATP-binding protein